MCAIAGFIKRAIEEPARILNPMVHALYHRGPDAAGIYHDEPYHVGMRRLRINDLATGDQPLYNEDRTVVLMYNGEIYNSPTLREELIAHGHRFSTYSDGEVICHLYEEVGEEVFGRLDGMFAIALWDTRRKRLLLARDLPGEKPLYFSRLSSNELVFASEIKSLRLFPGLNLELNKQALWDFPTFLWIPEPETVYRSVETLPRGSYLEASEGGITTCTYRNDFNTGSINLDDEAVIEETRAVVTSAVESRLLSDVPVGAFLSGGLDSSIVATLASQILPELTTFCIAFEDVHDPYHGRADESVAAAETADLLGSTHHTIRVAGDDFKAMLPDFCLFGDQPSAISSGLGVMTVARAARESGIKVLLTGDGADEMFGGYSWYFHLKRLAERQTDRPDLNEPVSFQNFGMPLDQRLRIMSDYSAPMRAWAWHYYAAESEKRSLCEPAAFEGVQPSIRHFGQYKADKSWEAEDYIRHDRAFYFPFEMLRKADRMTMAHAVEGRVPFAAPSVMSHAAKLNYGHMVRGDELKWCLRRAFEGILPDVVVHRPKHGFNVPIDHWLKGDWRDVFETAFAPSSALLKSGLMQKDSRETAWRMLNDPIRLNGHTVFCYIMLNYWMEQNV